MLIENAYCLIEFDPQNGAIRRIFDKVGRLELIGEARLAGNFALLLPLPDTQANTIWGTDQPLSAFERTAGGAVLRWNGPLRSRHGAYDVHVIMRVELAEAAVSFRLEVHNRSQLQLAEVWYPVLGGLTGLGARTDTRVMLPLTGYPGSPETYANLFQTFRGIGIDGLGTTGPEYLFAYPGKLPMPWFDIYNPQLGRGVYVVCHDDVVRYKGLRFELLPGAASGRTDSWPRPDETPEGMPVGMVTNWVSFPYTPPGGSFAGPAVVVQFHAGDWHAAADLYRQWFVSHHRVTDPADSWLHQELAYQATAFLDAEGVVHRTFRDMPAWAQEALDHGVKTVIVCGWDRGGQDNMYPYYEPDPRLGSWEELEAGIEACHRLGVKVVMFVNFQPIDCDTDWYRAELHRYRSMNPWGYSNARSWGWGTVGARMLITSRPMQFADLSFPEFRALIVAQMKKLAEIGADGIHVDKLAWDIVGLDFNPALTLGPDQAPWQGILQTVEEVLAACRAVNPRFCLSYEGVWDRMLAYSDVLWAWHSNWEADHTAAFRYTFPQWTPGMAVFQPFDYHVVNNALRYGYQLFVAAAHMCGSMSDVAMRPLSSYIREVLRIREELRDFIYTGEYLDVLEAQVTHDPDIYFNTHRHPLTHKRACVLVNHGAAPGRAELTFEGNAGGAVRVYRPFQPVEPARLPLRLDIPPDRVAIVVEE